MDIPVKASRSEDVASSPMPSFNEKLWRQHMAADEAPASLSLASRAWPAVGGAQAAGAGRAGDWGEAARCADCSACPFQDSAWS